MEQKVVDRYKSHEGAASFNVKYDLEWHKRMTTKIEYGVIARCFRLAGPQDLVLDMPCGAGRLFKAYQPFGRRFIVMDLSHEMVKFARENLADARPALGVGSAFHLPLQDRSVDCAFSARLFHHVPDWNERVKYIRELCRVSRGLVILTYFHTYSLKNILRVVRRPFNRKKPKVTMTTGQLREIAAGAGYEVVKSIPLVRLASGHHYAVLRRCSSTA